MNRDEFVRKVADKYNVNIKDTKLWFDAFVDVLAESVTEDDIKIRNFGNFELRTMKPKIARNLNDNTEVHVPARKKLYFVPCPKIAEKIKSLPVE